MFQNESFLETDDENVVGMQHGQNVKDEPESDEEDLVEKIQDESFRN